MHSKCGDLFNVPCDIHIIIPDSVEVEASLSLGQDVIGWGQLICIGQTLGDKVVIRQCAVADNVNLAGNDPELDTMNNKKESDLKIVMVER
jgi:hypothetical protein